jgi:P-type Ca2+ transporter type 2C
MTCPVRVRQQLMTMAVPSLERQQVLAALGGSDRGLAADEAAARRAEAGANQLPPARRRPVLAEFGAQFANMFAVVLMVAAGITFGAYALSTPRDSSSLVLAIGILGVVLLNAVIGSAQEHAAERTAEALQALVPATARVIRGGELTEIPAVDLVPGDLVMLDAGDAVSADCRLIDAHDLLVEMAALTGESRPTPRISDAVPQAQVADARNCVFMGTSVVNGSGRAVVFATGLATEFGRIYRLTAEMPSEDSPLQREVTVMARRVAAVAIAAGLDALPYAAGIFTEARPGSSRPSWPPSRSRPSTTMSTTRSPSAPLSPRIHPAPSPPCSPTPAPTTTATPAPRPARAPFHIWYPPLNAGVAVRDGVIP